MKSFKEKYPDFAAVEHHIRQARAERALYLAHVIAGIIDSVGKGIRRLLWADPNRAADLRAIEADAFLKRSVPKY